MIDKLNLFVVFFSATAFRALKIRRQSIPCTFSCLVMFVTADHTNVYWIHYSASNVC
jgi:hypothetical protein